ncbi:hypothetical protein [Pseudoalteromonas ardens]|uniref:Uncharacterized protein n=1 Tax=Pseudoalteromonas rubra TaxID=43658 RepID=A0A0L0ENV2_9GAMM|nr:hypothetical protein [Pseudoalteromonas sp. R96]KNC65573.1 hypothetical protein AC626_22290 [Pseudoalteromonas rubra]MDK1311967.1 hypothetical protein [Pseudoalteromonas sp. R96]
MVILTRAFYFLLINFSVFLSVHCFSAVELEEITPLLGKYKVESIERYGGGLTTKQQAWKRVGSDATLSNEVICILDIKIVNPIFKFVEYPKSLEGNIPEIKLSNFYGIGLNRQKIKVLSVFEPEDTGDEPLIRLEVIGDRILFLFDGWAYTLRKNDSNK